MPKRGEVITVKPIETEKPEDLELEDEAAVEEKEPPKPEKGPEPKNAREKVEAENRNIEKKRDEIKQNLEKALAVFKAKLKDENFLKYADPKLVRRMRWAYKSASAAKKQSFDIGKDTYTVGDSNREEGIPIDEVVECLRLVQKSAGEVQKKRQAAEKGPLRHRLESIDKDKYAGLNDSVVEDERWASVYETFRKADKEEGTRELVEEAEELVNEWERLDLQHGYRDRKYNKEERRLQLGQALSQVVDKYLSLNLDRKQLAEDARVDKIAAALDPYAVKYLSYHFDTENLNKEQGDAQNEFTKREAYFISRIAEDKDYKQILLDKYSKELQDTADDLGQPEDLSQWNEQDLDYRLAMLAVRDRKLLVLPKTKELPPHELPTKMPIGPEKQLGPWKDPEGYVPHNRRLSGEVKPPPPDRLTAVDISAQVEQLARIRADKRLTEKFDVPPGFFAKFNVFKMLKRAWYHATEEGYRQQYIEQERQKILGVQGTSRDKNQRSWKNLWRGKKVQDRAYGSEQLHENLAEHKEEIEALLERFKGDYIRASEGELKETFSDEKYNKLITDLIREYATTPMADSIFEQRKYEILKGIKKDHPNSALGEGMLTVDNFLEAAKEYRKMQEHGEGLGMLEEGLRIDLGVAKQAIKVEANLNWMDKLINRIQKTPGLGKLTTPTAVGIGFSVAAYISKKPAYLLGALGGGALVGGLRRHKEVKMDLAMHRTERAMGQSLEELGGTSTRSRRAKTEAFVQKMENADTIGTSVDSLRAALESSPSPESAQALAEAIADAEARMSIGEERKIALIEFSGQTQVERGRLVLLRALAEAKVALGKSNQEHTDLETLINDKKAEYAGEADKIDRRFAWFKAKEVAKAAAIGAVVGVTVGAVAQEAVAQVGDITGIQSLRPGGRQTGMEALYNWGKKQSSYTESWSDWGPKGGSSALIEAKGFGTENAKFAIPEGTSMHRDPATGLLELKDDATGALLAKFNFDPASGKVNFVEAADPSISFGQRTAEGLSGSKIGTQEWLKQFGEKSHVVDRERWYTQNTKAFDKNELKLWYGGENNTGFKANGDLDLDLSHMKEGWSYVGEGGKKIQANIGELIAAGKLKVFITPDGSNQSNGIMLDIDPATRHASAGANEAFVQQLFTEGKNGRAQFNGRFIEVVEIVGKKADGTDIVRPLATYEGKGMSQFTGNPTVYEFNRNIDGFEYPPVIPIVPRKALEKEGGGERKASARRETKEQRSEQAREVALREEERSSWEGRKSALQKELDNISDDQEYKGRALELVYYDLALVEDAFNASDDPTLYRKKDKQGLLRLHEGIKASQRLQEEAIFKILERRFKYAAVQDWTPEFDGEALGIHKDNLQKAKDLANAGKETYTQEQHLVTLDAGIRAAERLGEEKSKEILEELFKESYGDDWWPSFDAEKEVSNIYTDKKKNGKKVVTKDKNTAVKERTRKTIDGEKNDSLNQWEFETAFLRGQKGWTEAQGLTYSKREKTALEKKRDILRDYRTQIWGDHAHPTEFVETNASADYLVSNKDRIAKFIAMLQKDEMGTHLKDLTIDLKTGDKAATKKITYRGKNHLIINLNEDPEKVREALLGKEEKENGKITEAKKLVAKHKKEMGDVQYKKFQREINGNNYEEASKILNSLPDFKAEVEKDLNKAVQLMSEAAIEENIEEPRVMKKAA